MLTPIAGGMINRVYRVEAGEKLYVLKEYTRTSVSVERLARLALAQDLTRRQGVLVPTLLQGEDGKTFAQVDGLFFTLAEYVPGRHYEYGCLPANAARNMGAALARVLSALEEMPSDQPEPLPAREWIEGQLRSLLKIGSQRRSDSAFDDAACLILEQKLRDLEQVASPLATHNSQWIHGDYQWSNVLFGNDDHVVAIFDFDNLRYTYRARDVMRCLELSFPLNTDPALSFFEGYASVSGITPREVLEYMEYWRYISTFRVWPIDARYLDPEHYQARWDEFIQFHEPPSSSYWNRLTHELVDIAARYQ
jgi:Ser/Thr protein kinase RdoA (MazF antagonist)